MLVLSEIDRFHMCNQSFCDIKARSHAMKPMRHEKKMVHTE